MSEISSTELATNDATSKKSGFAFDFGNVLNLAKARKWITIDELFSFPNHRSESSQSGKNPCAFPTFRKIQRQCRPYRS
jgi:hypothetical protein